jgi:hypothetical protein
VRFGGVVDGADRFELAVNGREMVAGMYGELGSLQPTCLYPTHRDAMDGARVGVERGQGSNPTSDQNQSDMGHPILG